MKHIAIFASGNGSNFEAIATAVKRGALCAEIALLVCDKPDAYVITRAKRHNIPVFVFSSAQYVDKAAYEAEILDRLCELDIEFIVLAGYMRLVGKTLLDAYPVRIVNIHPSLLPAFSGKGAIQQAYDSGAKVTGVSVHFVDAGMDTGPVIAQRRVVIEETDTLQSLEEKIHQIEHTLYIETLQQLFTTQEGDGAVKHDVLVIGGGGREHALAWKFAQSPQVGTVYVAPGNPGMGDVAATVHLDATDFDGMVAFAKEKQISLTFVGPEVPLVGGIVDRFLEEGLPVFGPRANAAIIEGSKSFAKDLMQKYHIPTAEYAVFTDFESACRYIETQTPPFVIKADGLAAGKGVVIAETEADARQALRDMLQTGRFGDAGASVVIEEFLVGEEFSLLAFVNGQDVYPMVAAKDHKRAYDGDQGPNTGGMGAYAPVPQIPASVLEGAEREILRKTATAMAAEGRPFTGILYAGLIATAEGPKVIEFNARFGDPEAEVLLPLLESDLYQVLVDILNDKRPDLKWSAEHAIGVVLASKGYPGPYETGAPIRGLGSLEQDTLVFHCGTGRKDGGFVTEGGRVLLVAQTALTPQGAREKLYREIQKTQCDNLFYRTDIGGSAWQS